MADRKALSSGDVRDRLSGLSGWQFEGDRLVRSFEFADFREAIGFIVQMAFRAEALDHHPEVRNVYNRVSVALTTHDAGDKVTEMDFKLAEAIDSLFKG